MSYHFIGIGGIGMSALAKLLLQNDEKVSGSDLSSSPITQELKKMGATIHVGHAASNVPLGATIIYSSGVHIDNPELLLAEENEQQILHRSDLLKRLMDKKKSLAVAGTHGKTSTSAMLASVINDASYMVGGVLLSEKTNSASKCGEYFVAEADESDGTFLKYHPYGAIVTNIGSDHLDTFGDEEGVHKAFDQFMGQVIGPLIVHDSISHSSAITYGYKGKFKVRRWEQEGWKCICEFQYKEKIYSKVIVNAIGEHQVLNAAAVFLLALELGIPEKQIRIGLETYGGVKRRSERKTDYIIDDYAHHPTEIKVTLEAIRAAVKEKRLIAIFQPHRYSRMEHCVGKFEGVFDAADEVIITDIYAAGEQTIEGVSPKMLYNTTYIPRDKLCELKIHPHEVIVTLGAGDITRLADELAPPEKLTVGLVYGGRSSEHDISKMSSEYVQKAIDKTKFECKPIYISKSGVWDTTELDGCDVIFPVLHGPFGEDGTIQGYFEMMGLPYVGCDWRASAVAMDKALTKQLLRDAGIPTLPFVTLHEPKWDRTMEFPLFVKGVHMGSSLGCYKVINNNQLENALQEAFKYDDKVIIEPAVHVREIEFPIIGNRFIEVFNPGEILTGGEFYDYEKKYFNPFPTSVNPSLTAKQINEGKKLAKATFQTLGCQGMARVDTFLLENGTFVVNEVNPIPGFTEISLYPKLSPYTTEKLIERLIDCAFHKHRLRMCHA